MPRSNKGHNMALSPGQDRTQSTRSPQTSSAQIPNQDSRPWAKGSAAPLPAKYMTPQHAITLPIHAQREAESRQRVILGAIGALAVGSLGFWLFIYPSL